MQSSEFFNSLLHYIFTIIRFRSVRFYKNCITTFCCNL